MHVVVWEVGTEAVAYGPFPEIEADVWLHNLGVLMNGHQVRAFTAMVNPAYDLRTFIPAHLGRAPHRGVAIQRGTGLDRRAYGFVAHIMEDDRSRGLAGMWRSRDDATAWWAAQDGILAVDGVTHAEVLPIMAVPTTAALLLLNDAGLIERDTCPAAVAIHDDAFQRAKALIDPLGAVFSALGLGPKTGPVTAAVVLALLETKPGSTVMTLARTTGLSTSAVAVSLVNLETAGLATRQRRSRGGKADEWTATTPSISPVQDQ